jgi:hypothetical protein
MLRMKPREMARSAALIERVMYGAAIGKASGSLTPEASISPLNFYNICRATAESVSEV